MEWVRVMYPSVRDVFVDGRRCGATKQPLIVSEGRHRFDLGSPADYTPARRSVSVTRTTAANPMEIAFTPC